MAEKLSICLVWISGPYCEIGMTEKSKTEPSSARTSRHGFIRFSSIICVKSRRTRSRISRSDALSCPTGFSLSPQARQASSRHTSGDSPLKWLSSQRSSPVSSFAD